MSNEERIVKVVWRDTQTGRDWTFKEMMNEPEAILTAYGRIVAENDISLTLVSYYSDNAEKDPEDTHAVSSFYVRIIKGSIIEIRDLELKEAV